MRIAMCTGVALLVSATAFAQDEMARRQAVEVAARVPFEKAMTGAPYSADTVIESSQTLADGNRINRKTTGRVYRDSEGRTRREEDVTFRSGTPNGFVNAVRTTISIVDPVAGFSYSLDPEKKIAWKTTAGGASAVLGKIQADMVDMQRKIELEKMMAERKSGADDEPSKAAAIAAAGGGGRGGARGGGESGGAVAVARGGGGGRGGRMGGAVALEPLEHKTIEGVAVEGRRTTSVIPAGQVGNEQPITITSEEWRSPELNLLVLTKHSDPRSGESSYRLLNILRAEPDSSLFMVPADYTVRETGIRRMEQKH
jgi:hypothetical protein